MDATSNAETQKDHNQNVSYAIDVSVFGEHDGFYLLIQFINIQSVYDNMDCNKRYTMEKKSVLMNFFTVS